ncbi:MAG: UDP-N-acetylmuramoyl-L-alanyl-D-glutamate--2,6-diaminopimelate ligase [Gemmatimonadales bacterium]
MTSSKAILQALERAGQLVSVEGQVPPISGVTEDSRRVAQGVLFCAVEGSERDGHAYVEDARRRGAAAALVTRLTGGDLPQIVVKNSRRATALAAREWFGNPAGGLLLVGVTGTNGKSTTVALVRHLMNEDASVASIGTLGAIDGSGEPVAGVGSLTTPGPVELQAVLAELGRRGARTAIVEASSHALDQDRLYAVELRAAVYTNLTQDHLDYHGDLGRYRAAKLKLSDLLGSGSAEIVNADDPAWGALPYRPASRKVSFGRGGSADVKLEAASPEGDGWELQLRVGPETVATRLGLVGDFNVSNALAAAATAWALGVPPQELARRLPTAPQVPGRMERLVTSPFTVLRDYAHTPDALERAIAAARQVGRGRLIVLFGAGGDRDRSKRPLMGGIAVEHADLAIATSDNPRTEDPERIIADVEAGMGGREHLRITDRREAIRRALALLEPGDCLLLAGKGHETYQVIGVDRLPFDEKAIVEEAMRERAPA